MAKEITHMLIAQDVLRAFKESGAERFARLIEENLTAFFYGATIPDALYYDFPPFRINPLKYEWISRTLHQKNVTVNDERAMSLFGTIASQPARWPVKMAFAAGVATHTAADRVFHEAIEHYTETWGERGRKATATHREIETLVDMILLQEIKGSPGEFLGRRFAGIDEADALALCHLFISGAVPGKDHDVAALSRVLRRAHRQQRFFLRLFGMRPVRTVVQRVDRILGGRLEAWTTLFYPDRVDVDCFPVLGKLASTFPNGMSLFFEEVGQLRKAAIEGAVRNIQRAVDRDVG
jgi:hypothetical protein